MLRSRVPEWADGLALIDYLARRFPYFDREGWSRELAASRVACREQTANGTELLRRGDEVAFRRVHAEPPVDRNVRILHADADLAVAAKPAHLPAHADGAFVRNTLVAILGELLPGPRIRLVHRLDRETSGIAVAARTAAAARALDLQFRAGAVAKTYFAVVRGEVAQDAFAVDAPIGRDPASEVSMRRAVVAATAPDAQPSRTEFAVLARGAGRTLLRCVPRTGRTHQIRVHLAHAGHSLLGDKLYGRTDAEYLAFVHAVKAGGDPREGPPGEPGRHLLHAGALAFAHPRSGMPLAFEVPLPDDMAAWVPGREAGPRFPLGPA